MHLLLFFTGIPSGYLGYSCHSPGFIPDPLPLACDLSIWLHYCYAEFDNRPEGARRGQFHFNGILLN